VSVSARHAKPGQVDAAAQQLAKVGDKNTAKLLDYYRTTHDAICGRFPNENIFHEQYLSSFRHRRALTAELKDLQGVSVLDVGCGEQPYRRLLGHSCRYVGIDIEVRHPETLATDPARPWPVDGPFDVVLCTQVIEHVADLRTFCKEVDRVLAPGGKLLITVPFLFPIHDVHDYQRLTPAGVGRLFPGWAMERVTTFGGVGSSLALLMNSWIDNVLCFTLLRRLVKGLIFPLRLPLNAFLNVTALFVDWIDGTGRYFHNSMVVLRKVDL
jgi:SAM-dependent methyltransferase